MKCSCYWCEDIALEPYSNLCLFCFRNCYFPKENHSEWLVRRGSKDLAELLNWRTHQKLALRIEKKLERYYSELAKGFYGISL